ncbi:type II toxin-antitoxin system HicA family toxin [Halococcus sp. AFM35]|uniref:type II toxin-antitoxin system HicA family toxin n=1 Tax=Halococcus sp. AFM35 TaxID=3421653 RepID=UPI003EBCEF63
MVTRDFSGMEIVKVLGNAGNFAWVRTTGDHAIMKWTAPPDHETDDRTVSVPLHDHVQTGTLRNIAEDAGMNDFDEFCRWIDRNR